MDNSSKIFFFSLPKKKWKDWGEKKEYLGFVGESATGFDNNSKCTMCISLDLVILVMLFNLYFKILYAKMLKAAFTSRNLKNSFMKRGLVKKITVSKTMEYKF